MSDPMKVYVKDGWTPETVVAVAGPVPLGDVLRVCGVRNGRDYGLFRGDEHQQQGG